MSTKLSILSQYTDRPNNLFALLYRYRVTIPIFQRHYVQGANNPKAEDVRKSFVQDLLGEESLHLHFIYGPINTEGEDSFTPVDGQQRLTTLWLLARYAAEYLGDEEKNPILNLLSRFSYVGRMHAERFCKALTTEGNGWNLKISPDQSIRLQPWFWDEWGQDETVDSMLHMLETIDQKWKEKWTDSECYKAVAHKVISAINEKIIFSLQIDSFADDIYMKMNARGLQLTQWENFKGRFSEMLTENKEIQQRWDSEIEDFSNVYFKLANDFKLEGDRLPDTPFFTLFARLLVYEMKIQEKQLYQESEESQSRFKQLVEVAKIQKKNWEDGVPFVSFAAFAESLKEIGTDKFALDYLTLLKFTLNKEISRERSPYWDSERTLLSSVFQPNDSKEIDLAWLLFSYCQENGTDVSSEDFQKALRCMWNILENAGGGTERCKDFCTFFIEKGGPTLYEIKQIPEGKDLQWKEELVKGGVYRRGDSELIQSMQKAESWMHGRVRLGILNMTSDEHEACICKKRLDHINSLFKAWYSEQSDWQARKTIMMNIVAAYPYWDDNFYNKEWNIPIADLDTQDLRELLTSWWIDHLLQNNLCKVDTQKMLVSPIDKKGVPDADSPFLDWRQVLLNIATAQDGDEFKIYQKDLWGHSRVAYYGRGHFIVLYDKCNIPGSFPIHDWRILLGLEKNELGKWYRKEFFERLSKRCQQKYDPYDITCNDYENHSIWYEEKRYAFYFHSDTIGIVDRTGKEADQFIQIESVSNPQECVKSLRKQLENKFFEDFPQK